MLVNMYQPRISTIFVIHGLLLILSQVEARPYRDRHLPRNQAEDVDKQNVLPSSEQIRYLQKYGYYTLAGDATDPSLALRQFQRMASIEQTGTTDKVTLDMMSRPRCGVPDVTIEQEMSEEWSPRFNLSGVKWKKHNLSYKTTKYPKKFLNSKTEVDAVVAQAFKFWSDSSNLTFYKETGKSAPMIEVKFVSGRHGDCVMKAFDGPGHDLAHASYPNYGGWVHLDDDEDWRLVDNNGEGAVLIQTLTHEIGHALGLEHSDRMYSIMGAIYRYNPDFKLGIDDKRGIQKLYGVKEGMEKVPSVGAKPKRDPASSTTTTIEPQTEPATTTEDDGFSKEATTTKTISLDELCAIMRKQVEYGVIRVVPEVCKLEKAAE